MRYKIKSQTDVITNSSDETYIIRTPLSPEDAKSVFYEYMEKNHEHEWLHEYENHFPDRSTMFPDFIEKVRDGFIRISWDSMCNLEDAEGYIKEAFPGSEVFTEVCDHCYATDEEVEDFIGGPQERKLSDHWGPIDDSWMDKLIEAMPEGPEKEEARKRLGR